MSGKATSLEHLPPLGLHPAPPAGGLQVLKAPRSQPPSEVLGDTPALLLAINWLPETPLNCVTYFCPPATNPALPPHHFQQSWATSKEDETPELGPARPLPPPARSPTKSAKAPLTPLSPSWGFPGRLPRGHGFRSGPEVATTELQGPAHLAQAAFITEVSQS